MINNCGEGRVWDLVPGSCALLSTLGWSANLAVYLLGGVPIELAPGTMESLACQAHGYFDLYSWLWGNAPLLAAITLAAVVAGQPRHLRIRRALYFVVCLAFWLCPPLFSI